MLCFEGSADRQLAITADTKLCVIGILATNPPAFKGSVFIDYHEGKEAAYP